MNQILKRQVSAHYRRAHLGEVLYDLKRRTGLESAYPQPIDGSFTFDRAADNVSVRDVLEDLARTGHLKLEYSGNAAVFWKQADDAKLVALEKVVKDEQASGRCKALEELAQLGDKRIYPIMFWAMVKGSEPMALAAMRLLEKQHSFSSQYVHSGTLQFADELDQFGKGIERLLKVRPENERASMIRLTAATRRPSCGKVLLPMLDDPRQQGLSVYCIGQTRDPRTVESLLVLLEKSLPADPNNDTGTAPVSREMIIRALGEIGSAEATAALRALAEKKGNEDERLEAAGALARAGDKRGFEILTKMLLEPPRPPAKAPPAPGRGLGLAGAPGPPRSPQQLAVEYLVRSGREEAVEPLLRGFAVGDSSLRDWLARFVGELRDPRFVPPLIDVLDEEQGRQSALAALRMIGDRRAIEPIADQLADKIWMVRFLAAEALLDMGDARGKEAIKTLFPAENENWHREVLRLRALAGDDEGISALVVELTPGGTLRPRDAADTLGKVRDVATIEPLAEALKNPDPNDRFAAAMAISEMRHPQAIEKAAALLNHDEPAMRVWAARILGWMKDPLGVDPLLGALRDKNAEVRQHASRALVAIGDDRSLKAALAMLNDFDRDVRRYTAQALGPTRSPQVIEPLFTLVRDADSFVCQAAAEAILATHDPSAIKRLVMMVKPDNFAARALAASSTSFLNRYQSDACVLHELVVLTKDAEASVRCNALLALQSARDRCALSPLIAALDDPNEEVRKTARDLLSRHHDQEPTVRDALKAGKR